MLDRSTHVHTHARGQRHFRQSDSLTETVSKLQTGVKSFLLLETSQSKGKMKEKSVCWFSQEMSRFFDLKLDEFNSFQGKMLPDLMKMLIFTPEVWKNRLTWPTCFQSVKEQRSKQISVVCND